jgi:hypothetical protein
VPTPPCKRPPQWQTDPRDQSRREEGPRECQLHCAKDHRSGKLIREIKTDESAACESACSAVKRPLWNVARSPRSQTDESHARQNARSAVKRPLSILQWNVAKSSLPAKVELPPTLASPPSLLPPSLPPSFPPSLLPSLPPSRVSERASGEASERASERASEHGSERVSG